VRSYLELLPLEWGLAFAPDCMFAPEPPAALLTLPTALRVAVLARVCAVFGLALAAAVVTINTLGPQSRCGC
jgi:hypothetical protein